jgi:hypothetical protein
MSVYAFTSEIFPASMMMGDLTDVNRNSMHYYEIPHCPRMMFITEMRECLLRVCREYADIAMKYRKSGRYSDQNTNRRPAEPLAGFPEAYSVGFNL